MGERLVHFLRRMPRIVSRPGAELFGMRADGDSELGGSVNSVSPIGSRRSIELPRGVECPEHAHNSMREEPHVADDLEAAVETIENAKAKLQLLTLASSDDSGVIERASRTLKRIAKAEREVNRLAEQRERTVALSREHTQMHLALVRGSGTSACTAAGLPPTPGGGTGSGGGVGGCSGGSGSGGGAAARNSLGAASGPSSRVASVRSMRAIEHAVAGAAVGAGANGPPSGTPSYHTSSIAISSLPLAGGSPLIVNGRPSAPTLHMRASSESRAMQRSVAGDGDAMATAAAGIGPHDSMAPITAWRSSSNGLDGPLGGSAGGASSGGYHRVLPPPRLAVPPDGTSPVRPSPRAVVGARLYAARSCGGPQRSSSGGSGGAMGGQTYSHEQQQQPQQQQQQQQLLGRQSLPDMRRAYSGVSTSSAEESTGPGVRTTSVLISTTHPDLRRAGHAAVPSFSIMLNQQQQQPGQQQQQPGGRRTGVPPDAAVISIMADPSEDGEEHVLVPIGTERSDECPASGGLAAGERRGSLSSLPPIEPATSPILSGKPPSSGLATRLRGILRTSGGSERRQQQQRERRRALGNGARNRLQSAAAQQQHEQQPHSAVHNIEMQRFADKQQRADGSESLKSGTIGVEMVGSDGSSGSGGSSSRGGSAGGGAADARARWALVRRALDSGRLLRLPYDANNYSIVTSTFKRLFPRDFDCAIPVINHKEVDKLLMEVGRLACGFCGGTGQGCGRQGLQSSPWFSQSLTKR